MKTSNIVLTIPFEQRDKLCTSLIQTLLHINTSGMPGDRIEICFRDINKSDKSEYVQKLIINLN